MYNASHHRYYIGQWHSFSLLEILFGVHINLTSWLPYHTADFMCVLLSCTIAFSWCLNIVKNGEWCMWSVLYSCNPTWSWMSWDLSLLNDICYKNVAALTGHHVKHVRQSPSLLICNYNTIIMLTLFLHRPQKILQMFGDWVSKTVCYCKHTAVASKILSFGR